MRNRIDTALESLGRFCFRHAWGVIVGVVTVVGLGATQIPSIEVQASVDEFLSEGDETKARYDAFLAEFGRDDVIMIALDPEHVFEPVFLERLHDLHETLEDEVPHLREVQSLITARETRGTDDGLVVGELFEDWPDTPAELEAIRARALANPLYVDFLVTRDGGLTVVTVELEAFAEEDGDVLAGFEEEGPPLGADLGEPARLTTEQESAAVRAVQDVVARFDAPDFPIYAGGSPVLTARMMEALLTNITVFTILSTGMIAFFLTIVLRRLLGVVIPMVVALVTLIGTAGAMGTLGIPAMPISDVIPSFLLAVGVGASVHLIVIFLQRFDAGASREDAIADALGHSGLPIVMTCLTTAGGLASFSVAQLRPIAIFGVVSPLGLIICLVLTLTLAPALLAILPVRRARGASAARDVHSPRQTLSIRALTRGGDFAVRNPGPVILAACAVLALAIAGLFRIQVSFEELEWFPDDMPAKIATRLIDREFGGANTLEVLIETGEENGLHDPAVLRAMSGARQTLEGLQVGTVVGGRSLSLVDIVEEIHQALNEGRPEARTVPTDRALVSQELILFENAGSDDLEDVVDTTFETGRISLRLPLVDSLHYEPFGLEVQRILDGQMPEGVRAERNGMMTVMARTFSATMETLFRSYTAALLIITPLMMLLLGSFRLGLIAMIPNLYPIVLTLGLMGWTNQPLEMFSLLIGSVALGLAVDDTIHFMHGFRRRYAATGSVEIAVRETLQTTGQALLFTSTVLAVGFAIYLLSDLNNLIRFGGFTAFSIVMAFLADILLAPALMKATIGFSSIRQDVMAAESEETTEPGEATEAQGA